MIEAANASVQSSGKSSVTSRKTGLKRRGRLAWLISLIARLVTWAAILTILFRCPSTLDECDESSPFVCRHYFQVKKAVSPYAKPYYDKYAEPYVDAVRPYYNQVKNRAVVPARDLVILYGEPWAIKGRDFVVNQWESNGHPRIAQLQAMTRARYDESVAPHVSKVVMLTEPYYTVARAQMIHAVENIVYPAYELTKPYAIQGYHASHLFAMTTLLPAAQWSWTTTNAFLDRAVWPQLRVVYMENVEPQLVRIGERLGRYKSHAKSRVLRDSASTKTSTSSGSTSRSSAQTSLVSKPPPQSESQSVSNEAMDASLAAEKSQVDSQSWHSPVETSKTEEKEDNEEKVRKMVASDLQSWQAKFASQAEQGAAEIEDSVASISRDMMNEKGNIVGAELISQLEQAIRTEVDAVKQRINLVVGQHLDGVETDSQEETVLAVRSAGVNIKKKAQVIRDWRGKYDEELQSAILASSKEHFAILDETRSLALQHIGMKWAWTDGVTYKDWAKYHELKRTLSDWTEELKQLIVSHPTLAEAQDVSAQIEDGGMKIAAAAARELAKLKEVVEWKIKAGDTTDEFDADKLKLMAEERMKAAEDARLKAEEEARIKADEEARTASLTAEAERKNGETEGGDSEDDPRIRSIEEASESKPLISEDVTATDEAAERSSTDVRIESVKKSSASKPLLSETPTLSDSVGDASGSAETGKPASIETEAAEDDSSTERLVDGDIREAGEKIMAPGAKKKSRKGMEVVATLPVESGSRVDR